MIRTLEKYVIYLFLVVWIGVSFAALAGMYHLWWGRERVLYLGKSADEQRVIIWKNAGLPNDLLDSVKIIQNMWPEDVAYKFRGEHEKKSYAEYLLIPRIPNGSDVYTLNTRAEFSTPEGLTEFGGRSGGKQVHGGAWSFFLSLLALAGGTYLLRSRFSLIKFSLPECFSLFCLFVLLGGVTSKIIFQSIIPGFYVIAASGFCGIAAWCYDRIPGRKGKANLLNSSPFKTLMTQKRISWFGSVAIVIIILGVAWSFIMAVVVVPDDWDAWAIWGAKAKMLLQRSGSLADVTSVGHPDYPLLWPIIWAFSAWFSGGWEELWSRGWGSVFLLLGVWEVAVITKRLTNDTNKALLAGALVVSMPMVPLVSSWSYAEAPFLLLTTSCAGCLLLRCRDNSLRITVVAALLALAAAHTKNEGVMFALLAALWILALPGQQKLFNFILFLGVFSVGYFPWRLWISYDLGLESHATAGLQFSLDNISRALERTGPAFKVIFKMWGDIKQWNIVLGGLLILSFIALFRKKFWTLFILPLSMLSGYFVIIVFHHAEIYWQVGTSWNRLTLHALPLLVIAAVCLLAEKLDSCGQRSSTYPVVSFSSNLGCGSGSFLRRLFTR